MISDIKQAIQTAIQNNLGITCYTSVIGAPNPPCAYILPRSGDYLINFPLGKAQIELDVILLLQRGDVLENVQDKLDTYLLPVGTGSMKAAIQQADLSNIADWLRVNSFSDYGGLTFGDTAFIGCKWHVSVMI